MRQARLRLSSGWKSVSRAVPEAAEHPLEEASGGPWKRSFDIVGAALFLVISTPLLALIALAIKLDTRGPMFYRQTRVGRGGRLFSMLKFRKMREDLPTQGPMLTRRIDPRLTRVGRFLERTKFDELPQLLNVLRGEMSLIGPRPEVPRFVDLDDPQWQVVLSVRPGIFGANQLLARNESELYPDGCEDLEGYYLKHILPGKLEIDAEYVRRGRLLNDLLLLVRGVMAAAFGTVTGSGIRSQSLQVLMLVLDVGASAMSLTFGFYMHLGGNFDASKIPGFWNLLALAVVCRAGVFLALGVYRRRLYTLTYSDLIRIIKSILYGSALLLVLAPLAASGIPRSVLLFDALSLGAILMVKAYGIHQMLRSHLEPTRLRVSSGTVAVVAVATLVNVLAFLTLIRWWELHDLSNTSRIRLAGLILGFATVRAYGFLRYGLFRPSAGWSLVVFDLPRLLRGVLLGSLFVYMGDTMLYSELVTFPVLLTELSFSTGLLLLLNRTLGMRAEARANGGMQIQHPTPARLLLIGIGPETEFYLCYLENVPPPKPSVLGVVDNRQARPRVQTINNVEIVGNFGHLGAFLEAHSVDQVVYFPSVVTEDQTREIHEICRRAGIPARSFPDLLAFSAVRRAEVAQPAGSAAP